MPSLKPQLRRHLEKTIFDARKIVVADVTDRLKELNVHEGKRGALTETQAKLRVRLRAHGKQIGDVRNSQSDAQQIDRLVQECAYEQWHRMIFVRFLAENEFLIDPEYGQSVSMEALAEIAEESKVDPWVLGGQFASAALPAIFRKDDPLLEVKLSTEAQRQLNDLLGALPSEVFTAEDSLGWVYQFWQSEEKDRVNASGDKIDGRSIPAVTQLFTEHYMVLFLLHNTLGAWHAGKVLARNPNLAIDAKDEAELRRAVALETAGGYEFEYLRFFKVEEASSLLQSGQGTTNQGTSFQLANNQLVREEKSQDGSSTFDHNWFDWNQPIDVGSGNLPHIKQEGVTYFVTFRTADSLPAEKWKAWNTERDTWLEKNPKPHTDEHRKEYYAKFPAQIEKWLDQKYGALVLADAEPNKIVDVALKHFDGDRYVLDEYVVVANHVHALVTPLGDNDLSDILHSWKSFTANKINKHLGKSGVFWQKESFDHAVRSPESLEKFRAYIRAHKVEEASSLLTAPPDFVSENESDEYLTGGEKLKSLEGKVLDPSCGSGHFLVAAFELLVRLRMHEEELPVEAAVESVLRDNLFGLEIDPRCTQIAAFNVAMAVWKLTGPKPLPPMRNIACSGIPLGNSRDEWMKSLKVALPNSDLGFQWGQLYDMFSKADTLGSLINPQRFLGSGLITDEQLEQISEALATIIADDRNASDEQQELAAAAQGLTRATELLSGRYTLVLTNVPYLGRGKQNDELKVYLDAQYTLGKADLATAFVLRSLEFCTQGGSTGLVTPQNWLFLPGYRALREKLLAHQTWESVTRLGPNAFRDMNFWASTTALTILSRSSPRPLQQLTDRWRVMQGTTSVSQVYAGLDSVLDWASGGKDFSRLQGMSGWGKPGIVLKLMGQIQTSLHVGAVFDSNVTIVVPKDKEDLAAIWAYCSSSEYAEELNAAEQAAKINNATATKVPFDRNVWRERSKASRFDPIPEPESDDPTQWLFHGRPEHSTAPVQVAAARLLGYRWPAEFDRQMRLSQRARNLVARCDELDELVDDDGIVCIPSVRGEDPASDRLLRLLHAAGVNHSENLETWLRDKFFQEHCELFLQRPFIWHIWDGKKDGFAALVNYHKLAGPQGKKLLESLTYSYLGDWVTRQRFPPKIKWTKDRGKEPKRPPEDYPWFWGWDENNDDLTDFAGGDSFTGDR